MAITRSPEAAGPRSCWVAAGASIVVNGSHVNSIASSLPVVLNQTVECNLGHVAGRLTFRSVVSGAGGFTKIGPGVMAFASLDANTYAGLTRVKHGELRLSNGGLFSAVAVPGTLVIGDPATTNAPVVRLYEHHQIANTALVVVDPDGTLDLNGFNDTLGPITLTEGVITTGAG